jgi:murein DD-endopeptidase MepM/ murein hydrolase activator NlpD
MIVIAHGDDIFTVYAHNRKNEVDKGDRVQRGQLIAEVGNTGRSTGPHLHFEIRVKNKVRNPAQYLSKLKGN